ncbi:MAG: hypothetical protein H6838_10375 [Planctomycetes bacterium]|nr:hypothetical protein [Planctomycetota bacterium]
MLSIAWICAAAAFSLPQGTEPPPELHLTLEQRDDSWRDAVSIADGAVGNAARFDGDRAHIDAGPCPIDSRQPFTLRCRLRTSRGDFCTPLMARDGEAVGISLVLGRQPGRISFEAWSWTSVRLSSQVRVDDGAWHELEVAYDPTTNGAVLFVDGTLQTHAELGHGAAPAAQLRLGDNIGAHQPFAGDLDEVHLVRSTNHAELLAQFAPVLSLAEREQALAGLRDRALPRSTPSLAERSAADWPRRRAAVRAHVADALGLSPPPAAAPLDVQVHGEVVRDGVRLQRISWIGFPGQRATGWLWSPDPAIAGRHPAMLCPHGHWQNGAIHPVVQARCSAFARFGWVTLAVDSVHVEDVATGVNSVGAMTWHNQRALDLLLARDDVDPQRVGVTGASGGGQQTYYLMALEERLAVAAPMVMACYLYEIVSDTGAHCGCNHTPRLAAGTDVPEMCAVFAPNPAMFGSVSGDWTHNFPQQGLPELTAHWARLGGQGPRSRFADEGHNYDRPMREEVYDFLQSCFFRFDELGHVPSYDAVSWKEQVFAAAELQPLLAARPNATLDPGAMAREYLARRPRVATLAALAPGLDLYVAPRTMSLPCSVDWLGAYLPGNDGVPIPLRKRNLGLGPYTVVVDPRGGAALLADAPPWLAKLDNAVLVDPRPYGEWARFRSAWQRNGILLGRGEGYQAALDTAIVCASLPGGGPVRLVGLGEAGVVALLAARLCPRITEVVVDDLGPSYAAAPRRLPLCPELRRWRDVPELAADLPSGCELRRLDELAR